MRAKHMRVRLPICTGYAIPLITPYFFVMPRSLTAAGLSKPIRYF
jgi:hypothetical protein